MKLQVKPLLTCCTLREGGGGFRFKPGLGFRGGGGGVRVQTRPETPSQPRKGEAFDLEVDPSITAEARERGGGARHKELRRRGEKWEGA